MEPGAVYEDGVCRWFGCRAIGDFASEEGRCHLEGRPPLWSPREEAGRSHAGLWCQGTGHYAHWVHRGVGVDAACSMVVQWSKAAMHVPDMARGVEDRKG